MRRGDGRDGAVDVGEVRLAYRTHGRTGDAPVVLLHGMASGRRTWDVLARELAGRGHLSYALDQRGHGGSSRTGRYPLASFRDDVLAFLDLLGLDRVDLVGHSLGAYVATLVARQAPERVRRLVLEECPLPPRDPADVLPDAKSTSLPWRELGAIVRHAAGLRRLLGFDRRMTTNVLAQLRAPDPDWWHALAATTAPTLVIRGGASTHRPSAAVDAMVAALPDARFASIPGAGHRVHSEHPAAFTRLVADFLD